MLHILADSVFEATRTAAFRYDTRPADRRLEPAPLPQARRSLPRILKACLGLGRRSGTV